MAAWKRRIVYASLALIAAWPLVHVALVRRFELSPWKLAGWGMYTTPRFDLLGMEIYGRDAATGNAEQLTSPSGAEREAATAYLEGYRWLRGLADDGGLTGVLFTDHPAWDRVTIVVFRPELDRDTGRITMQRRERVRTR
jgi:hypothetical protein